MTTRKPKTAFETEPCSRCGGSGNYSYNAMDGTRCYGCGGCGYKLSKRGSVAKKAFLESMTKPASEVKVGDQIFDFIGLSANRVWQHVSEIREDRLNKDMATFTLTRNGKEVCGLGLLGTTKVISVSSNEERSEKLAAALAYQSSLTKAGKPMKRAA